MTMTRQEVVARFVAELTRVLGALVETSASSRPGEPMADAPFVAVLGAADADAGELRIHFGRAAAEALAVTMSASAEEPTEARVLQSLTEICTQAAAAFERHGRRLVVRSVTATADAPDPASALFVDIVMAGYEQVVRLALSGDLDLADPAGEAADRGTTLDAILDLELPLVVRFGRTRLPLKALTALGPGSLLDLGRTPEEAVDVLVSNRVVARGEVVIVSGNYGVRIRHVISPADRARSLEAHL